MPTTVKTSGKKNIRSLAKEMSEAKILAWMNLKDDAQYKQAIAVLEYLMLNTPDSPDNPESNLIEFLSIAVEKYEKAHGYRIDDSSVTAIDVLKHLMEEHGLTQSDLPEIGNQAKVSEILRGVRKLNTRQIKGLTERFNISADLLLK